MHGQYGQHIHNVLQPVETVNHSEEGDVQLVMAVMRLPFRNVLIHKILALSSPNVATWDHATHGQYGLLIRIVL